MYIPYVEYAESDFEVSLDLSAHLMPQKQP